MKGIIQYIKENRIESYLIEFDTDMLNESESVVYHKHDKRFNFDLIGYGHPVERSSERRSSNSDIAALVKDCWNRIKKGIEDGLILVNQTNSGKSGAQVCLHSSTKDDEGYYLTVVFFVQNHVTKNNQDYYTLLLKTVFNGTTVDEWKEGKNGKSMYHPERGQLDMWDSYGISSGRFKDVMKVSGGTAYNKRPNKPQNIRPNFKIKGFIDPALLTRR